MRPSLPRGGKRDRGLSGDEEGLPSIHLSPKAHDRFVVWRAELEHRLRRGEMDSMLESHLAKYRKLVPGLALSIQLADGGTGAVNHIAVEKALRWAGYLETHAVRTYASTTTASADAARAIIAKIKTGHLKEQFGSREIVRAQWSMLRDRETIHAALQMLVDNDWLSLSKIQILGRPATVYLVNPKALRTKIHKGVTDFTDLTDKRGSRGLMSVKSGPLPPHFFEKPGPSGWRSLTRPAPHPTPFKVERARDYVLSDVGTGMAGRPSLARNTQGQTATGPESTPGLSDRECARRLRTALLRYREGAWRRTRSEALCPPHHAGKLTAVLWMVLKVADRVPSERLIRAVLACCPRP